MVFIQGRIQTRSWEAQDGTKRSRTEIIVEQMQLGPRGAGTSNAPGTSAPVEEAPIDTIQYPQDEGEINPDEIPF